MCISNPSNYIQTCHLNIIRHCGYLSIYLHTLVTDQIFPSPRYIRTHVHTHIRTCVNYKNERMQYSN